MMDDLFNDFEFKLAKLALGPDDLLVIKPAVALTSIAAAELIARLGRRFESLAGRVMVIDPDMDLSVVSTASAGKQGKPDAKKA
jgi:hypothetical protein